MLWVLGKNVCSDYLCPIYFVGNCVATEYTQAMVHGKSSNGATPAFDFFEECSR